jgi:predicted Zn-dependent peptidase
VDPAELEIVRGSFGPVPWFAADVPPPFMAGITFRVGRADETVATLGWTHLIEHLILPDSSRTGVDFHNGTVDNLFTSIWAGGSPDSVRRFLERALELLRELPAERVDLERRILAAEEESQPWGPTRHAFTLRFGPVGHGLAGYLEYGLRAVTRDQLAAWAGARFTAGNTAVWMTDPAFELELPLPSGPARPAPEPRPIPYVEYPCFFDGGAPGGVLLSMLLERSYAGSFGLNILEGRLQDRLRHELGISYGISVDRIPLTADLAHATVLADVNDTNAEWWCAEAVAIADELSAHGPTDDELESERIRSLRQATYVSLWSGVLDWSTGQHLLGQPFETKDDARRAREDVTPDAVATAFRAARSTLFVLGPATLETVEGFTEYPLTSPQVIEGKRHRPSGVRRRLGRQRGQPQLTSSADGVTLTSPTGSAITARFGSTVLCIREPGARTLLTDDGFFVPVRASEWQDGEAVLAAIDAAIPVELVVSESAMLDANVDDVTRLAAATFKRTWHVSDELEALPGLLGDGEEVLALGAGNRGWRWGLLAVTDRRLCYVYGSGDSSKSLFLAREDVSGARADGSTLHVVVSGEDMKFTNVEPRGKAEELADALRSVPSQEVASAPSAS